MSLADPEGASNERWVTTEPWQGLRRFTAARIALGRAGHSLPTQAHLAFQLAHAQARDAVHLPLDVAALAAAIESLRVHWRSDPSLADPSQRDASQADASQAEDSQADASLGQPGLGWSTLCLHSAAADRLIYLQRPDLGRRLDDDSRQRLLQWQPAQTDALKQPPQAHVHRGRQRQPEAHSQAQRQHHVHAQPPSQPRPTCDVAFVVADGLSALAVHRHAAALLAALLPRLAQDARPWRLAPVVIVAQGRVAVGDEVGALLNAHCVAVLIGERPGLSSPDSLGIYLTWAPRVGLTDASRNCISNVRPEGLAIEAAAHRLHRLMAQARQGQRSGVALKDDSEVAPLTLSDARTGNFLLAPPPD